LARLKCPGCGTDDGSSRRRKKSDPVGAILEGIGVKKNPDQENIFRDQKKSGSTKKIGLDRNEGRKGRKVREGKEKKGRKGRKGRKEGRGRNRKEEEARGRKRKEEEGTKEVRVTNMK
jgi:hypothetical protein